LLEREWNSRDEEYVAGRSHVLHYTTIHTQPWQPFPDRYVYQRNAVSQVWLDLERSADRAHYQVFTAAQPSTQYRRAIRRLADAPAVRSTAPIDRELAADLEQLLRDAGATSVGAFQLGRGDGLDLPIAAAAGRDVSRTVTDELATLPEHTFDVIVSAGAL